MNQQIIKTFEILKFNSKDNRFKVKAYKKALNLLRKLDYEITLINLYSIEGFSKKITDRMF